jgi:hypothetical protein
VRIVTVCCIHHFDVLLVTGEAVLHMLMSVQ